MSARSELRCCEMCGRDTTNKCGICRHCLSGRPSFVREKGMSKNRSRYLTGTLKDEKADDPESSDARYHGDNYQG